MTKKCIAIVTGASSGLGREFVRQLDDCLKKVDEIWLIARRQERLLDLKAEIENLQVRILPLDIKREADLNVLSGILEVEQPVVRLLINSAGVGRAGRFEELTREEATNMVEVNNKALVALTHMVLPYMRKGSNLIQVASASAFLPQKEFAVYAASKSFVLSFTRALRAEVKDKGIKVTAVCPGPVDTEFLTISNEGRKEKKLKKLVTVNPKVVAIKALRDAKEGKELSIYGVPMNAVYIAAKVLPHKLLLH